MSTTKRKRGRKRKTPDDDSFDDEKAKQPQRKKRKLSHPRDNKRENKRNIKNKKDDKSQSVEPKVFRQSNPFKDTTVPNMYNKSNKSHKSNNDNRSKKPQINRRHSQYNSYDSDDDDDDDDDDEEDEEEEEEDDDLTSPLLMNHKTRRSLPTTPVKKINNDKKQSEPHSQSAKRSRGTKKYISPYLVYNTGYNNNNKRDTFNTLNILNRLNTLNTSNSPPPPITENDRKQTPNLFSSQDSMGFSPEPISPIKKSAAMVIPVAPTPIRKTMDINNNMINDEKKEKKEKKNKKETKEIKEIKEKKEKKEENEKKEKEVTLMNILNGFNGGTFSILMFMFIGFIIGFIVAFSVYRENQLKGTTPIRTTRRNDIKQNNNNHICSCDVTTNTSSNLCNPCMNQYWSLQTKCNHCYQEQIELNNKVKQIKLERNELTKCELERDYLSNQYEKCRKERVYGDDTTCSAYKQKVDELQHNLGECNVEWGTCEQKGRQKDKLDEMRIEEIEKQKEKFSLCNEQLKRYKEAAKKHKVNR